MQAKLLPNLFVRLILYFLFLYSRPWLLIKIDFLTFRSLCLSLFLLLSLKIFDGFHLQFLLNSHSCFFLAQKLQLVVQVLQLVSYMRLQVANVLRRTRVRD
jgi:hypothetical protein